MLLVAADHPARGALGVRGAGAAMASRSDLLERLVTALERPGVDGVLGTPDILDDLLLLGALDDKVAIGSMNRGGLQGASFELDDRFTAYTAAEIAARGIDGGKMLTRICLEDPGTVATLEASARAVTELAEHRAHGDGRAVPLRRARAAGSSTSSTRTRSIKSIHIAAGLGAVERLHLAQAARRRRARPGHGRDDAADAAPRRRPAGRPAATRTRRGAARSTCPPCVASSSAAPCSTRPTATSPRPSTSPPAWCTGAGAST